MFRRIAIGLVLVFLVALPVGAAENILLWGKARYGMSVQEVQRSYPQALQPEKIVKLGTGSKGLLEIQELKIVGETFRVTFYFRSARLVQVSLNHVGTTRCLDSVSAYQSLLTPLRVKYGPEINREKTEFSKETNWHRNGVDVTMLLMCISEPMLVIVYQVRLLGDLDKL